MSSSKLQQYDTKVQRHSLRMDTHAAKVSRSSASAPKSSGSENDDRTASGLLPPQVLFTLYCQSLAPAASH